MANQNHFLKFHALGYKRFCPIVPPGVKIYEKSSLNRQLGKSKDPRGKAAGLKNDRDEWYGFDFVNYENDEEDLHRWHAMGAGVGIKTGRGLVMIDADTTNEEWAKIIRDEVAQLIPLTSVRVGLYPKAGYVVRTDEDFIYSSIGFGELNDKDQHNERVEILAEGKQFVAHGIHPKTLKPYTWPKGIPAYDDLPFVSGDDLLALLRRLADKLPAASRVHREGGGSGVEVDQNSLKGDLEAVRAAVRAMPNTHENFPRREDYRDVGYAIKAALVDHPDEAFEIFWEWCQDWIGPNGEINEKATVKSDWKRMKPTYRRGARWLYEQAEKISRGEYREIDAWIDTLPKTTIDLDAFKPEERKAEEAKEKAAGKEDPKNKFVFLDFNQAADGALTFSSKPLIKGLIDQETMSVIYGDSNVGKTFVTMDMAHHVATGTSYAGLRTNPARVIYVAAEGGKNALGRVRALREKYGTPGDPSAFLLLPMPLDLRRPEADLKPFLAAVNNLHAAPGMIVVDTLSRALAGGDENSSVDMGAIVKHFDVIRNALGSHLMVVHHTGKNKAAGARGHSLLRAATDTEIEVTEGQIAVTKQRDLDKSWGSGFELEVKTLGIDEDLDPITSCTVRLVAKREAGSGRIKLEPTAAESRVLECLEYMIEDLKVGGNGVTVEQLMAGSEERLGGMNAELLRAHLRNLKEKGHVVRPKRGFWALETEDFASSVSETKRIEEAETEENGRKRNADIFG